MYLILCIVIVILLVVARNTKKTKDVYENPDLLLNAAEGNIQKMRDLLDNGTDIDQQNKYGDTALMHAAVWGQSEAVAFLIERGANISIRNNDGIDPLIAAKLKRRHKTIQLLQNNTN